MHKLCVRLVFPEEIQTIPIITLHIPLSTLSVLPEEGGSTIGRNDE